MPVTWRQVTRRWVEVLSRAEQDAAPWRSACDEVRAFYFSFSPTTDESLIRLYGKAGPETRPRFQVQILKAYEAVSLLGPLLSWSAPIRRVSPKRVFPQISGIEGLNDPMLMQLLTAASQEDDALMPLRKLRATLIEQMLNYWPARYGLTDLSRMATIDGLLTGRAVAIPVVEVSEDGGIQIGHEHIRADSFLIDPEAWSYEDAGWVAIRVSEPRLVVAERWGIEPELLQRGYNASTTLGTGKKPIQTEIDKLKAKSERDLVTYYRVWSRAGAIPLTAKMDPDERELWRTLPKKVYLEICDGFESPLNVIGYGDDPFAVGQYLGWPIDPVTDNPFPVTCIDFSRMPGYCYPIPPLAPALGEIKALNLLMSHLITKTWRQSRDVLGVPTDAADQVRELLDGDADEVVIPLDVHQRSVDDQVQFLSRPPVPSEPWRLAETLHRLIEMRTGLNELIYGSTPESQPRSAADVTIRKTFATLRVDYMASLVEKWQIDLAKIEALATARYLNDVTGTKALGRIGYAIWSLVNSDPDSWIHSELEYSVSAGPGKVRGRQAELEELNEFMRTFNGAIQQIVTATGSMQPVLAIMRKWSELVGFDLKDVMLSPEQVQAAQAQQQAMLQQMQQAQAQPAQQVQQQAPAQQPQPQPQPERPTVPQPEAAAAQRAMAGK